MRDADLVGLVLVAGLLVLVSLTAGDIVSELLAPVPSIAGPLGAAAALTVFIALFFKIADVLLG